MDWRSSRLSDARLFFSFSGSSELPLLRCSAEPHRVPIFSLISGLLAPRAVFNKIRDMEAKAACQSELLVGG